MHVARYPLRDEDVGSFDREGFLYIRGLYDPKKEIRPIQRDIYRLIGMVLADDGAAIEREAFGPETFDAGLDHLLKGRRQLVSRIYDAVKKIPSYVKLSCTERHEHVAAALLRTDLVGFANRGYGMRMDNPNEDQYLTQPHQDYVSQLCSPRGLVFWSPLRRATVETGLVRIFRGSHVHGVFPIVKTEDGSRGLVIDGEEDLVRKFEHADVEVDPGDAVVMDFMTLHQSTPNRSDRTRWSMLSRYFDMNEPIGRSHGWKGGLAEGNSFESLHPELTRIREAQRA